jgi:hypothetical protein
MNHTQGVSIGVKTVIIDGMTRKTPHVYARMWRKRVRMSDFNFAPDRWEFWRELPDPDDEQYERDYDVLGDMPSEEEEESEDELQRIEWERIKRR